jgi:C-terminal processing protease CtpA/Prc
MNEVAPDAVVSRLRTLVETHYVFPEAAAEISRLLGDGLAAGRYPAGARSLAETVTADLQSVNGDKHLRLLFHEEELAEQAPGDDSEQYAAMTQWAEQTCGGVGCVQRLEPNVGYLDLSPVLFPAAISGASVTAAMSLVACADALLLDLRGCLGGEPAMVAHLVSYLWDEEPVQLTGLRERAAGQVRQSWTLPHVAGRRFGKVKPVYVVTGPATFSGGEQLAYDLQQLGRARIVGERTRGGANAREAFRVHPHLEATISVAAAVSPVTGTNWEGTGVAPDIETSAEQARDVAYEAALQALQALAG